MPVFDLKNSSFAINNGDDDGSTKKLFFAESREDKRYDNEEYYRAKLSSYDNDKGMSGEPRLIPVKSYTMTNKNRIEIVIISWGATIVSLKFPDKFGRVADVVLGFDDIKSTKF